MGQIKYSDYFCKSLKKIGYTHCFLLQGGSIMHLVNSASKYFKVIPFLHEHCATIASEYFNKANKGKKNKFCSPAFNFDEVVTLPKDAILLASNNINKISSISFNHEKSEIWGIQYHPEIKYEKMIELIKFRKDRLINQRKAFKSYDEIDHHISLIKNELSKSEINHRMIELKNWLGSINGN